MLGLERERAGVLSSVTPLAALTWRNKQRHGLRNANISNNVQFCNYKVTIGNLLKLKTIT